MHLFNVPKSLHHKFTNVVSTSEFIENPSELIQSEAVKENAYAIEFIKNPSELVQLEALSYFNFK